MTHIGFDGSPDDWHGIYAFIYMWEMWDVMPVTHERTDEQWKVEQCSVWAESAKGLEMMFLTRKESNGPKIGPITAKNVPKAAAKIEGFFYKGGWWWWWWWCRQTGFNPGLMLPRPPTIHIWMQYVAAQLPHQPKLTRTLFSISRPYIEH